MFSIARSQMRTESGCRLCEVSATRRQLGNHFTLLLHKNSSSICPLLCHIQPLSVRPQPDGWANLFCVLSRAGFRRKDAEKHTFSFTLHPLFILSLLYLRTQPVGFCFFPTTAKSCALLNIQHKLSKRNWKITCKIPNGKKC